MPRRVHEPVMVREVLEYLNVKTNMNIIDATYGSGGHATAILERVRPHGCVLGIERDPALFKIANRHEGITLKHGTYTDMQTMATAARMTPIHGVLFDFGVNIFHFVASNRGFSFQKTEPLDMRFDTTDGETAAHIINTYPADRLTDLIGRYGEERYARGIAQAIVRERKRALIITTDQLVAAVSAGVPAWYRRGKTHFATRTFQAFRIAVNRELDTMRTGLEVACSTVAVSGRVLALTYHSLEHKLVKQVFGSRGNGASVTAHAIKPTREEIKANPSARSAQLRIWERTN
ncbi:MAG: 16S rRNA (cytosine(1402)-N(4))-methyltransferase RsmH [Patescibacteria group bacterium]